jgi:tryptophan-rich sensory protein
MFLKILGTTMVPRTFRTWLLPVLCIALPLIVGIVGSFFTAGSIPGWYAGLNKPAINPPAWVFGPVWTVLYILMGISLYLVLRDGTERTPVRQGVILFTVQLALNLLWSIVFFYGQAVAAALVVLLLLIVLIAATAISFRRISVPAAWLLAPYLAWCCFAAVLNAQIWLLNGFPV